MIGSQIKYEPAFANREQKKLMKSLNIQGGTRTLGGLNRQQLIKTCKGIDKVLLEMQESRISQEPREVSLLTKQTEKRL
jgi:hypothetical protein